MVARLQIGSVGLDDGRSLDEGVATGWFFSDLLDWDGLTEVKGGLRDRPIAHGSFSPGPALRQYAAPSFVATYMGATGADAAVAARKFTGALSGLDSLRMEFQDDDGLALWRRVRVKRAVPIEHRGGNRIRRFEVYVEAADPLLYGAEVSGTTGVPTPGVGIADPLRDPVAEGAPGNLGRVELLNSGTAPTSVRIAVQGGLSDGVQVQVVETGEVLRLERLIPDGSRVEFDSRTGRVSIDGQSDVTGFLTVDQWSQVPAESARTFQFTPLGVLSGTPTMRVALFPAYL